MKEPIKYRKDINSDRFKFAYAASVTIKFLSGHFKATQSRNPIQGSWKNSSLHQEETSRGSRFLWGNPTVVCQVKEEEGRAGRRKKERNRQIRSIECINHDLVIYRFKCEALPEY